MALEARAAPARHPGGGGGRLVGREDGRLVGRRREGRLWALGDGAEKSRSALEAAAPTLTVVPPDERAPSAAWVARRGRARLDRHGPDDLSSFEPLYVKDVHATPAPSPFA